MTARDMFIDAVSGIDDELLTAHVQRRHPTKAQKIRHYIGVAAIYAAACLVVAVILPFIIGHGDDPVPVPGNDPIKTETTDPTVTDPEARQIKIEEIYEKYLGVTLDSISDTVTREEVQNIVDAARQAYEEYDAIELTDGTVVITNPKRPDITLADLMDMKVNDQRLTDMDSYIKNAAPVIVNAIDLRFPEKSKILWNTDTSMYNSNIDIADYYILDPDYTGEVKDADCDVVSVNGSWVILSPKDDEGTVQLHPTYEEAEIIRRTNNYEVGTSLRPIATTTFEGCRYTLILNQKMYNQYYSIIATVILENDGDEPIGLYNGHTGGDASFLDNVVFYENGEAKYDAYTEQRVYLDAIQTGVLNPGEHIIYKVGFDPCDAPVPADINSEWEIRATVAYCPGAKNGEFEYSDTKTATLTVEVPHEDYAKGREYVSIPTADSMVFGYDGKTVRFLQATNEYGGMKRYAGELFIESTTEQIYLDVSDSDVTAIKQDDFIEFVYDSEKKITFDESGEQTIAFTRLLIPLSGDNEFLMILGKDAGYSKCAVYMDSTEVKNLRRDVKEFVETALAEPEPPVTEPPVTDPPATEPPATAAPVTEEPIVSEQTTAQPPETTPAVTEPPVEEVITYPDPYISNQTDTSITKTLFGCEYTVTIDKPKYEQGDIVTVVVTLENKGKSTIYLNGQHLYHDLDYIYFFVNGRGVIEVSGPPIGSDTPVSPGEKMSYTTKFDTTEAKLTGVWSVESGISFTVYGTRYSESIEIEIPHDGVDPDAFSPVELTNPFTGDKYYVEFGGTGEIVIIMEHDTSLSWSSYLNAEYLGFELEKVEPWTDPEDEKEYIAANPSYRSFVSIFLKDKSDEAVVDAMNRLYELDLETDFIYTAHPKTPEFS